MLKEKIIEEIQKRLDGYEGSFPIDETTNLRDDLDLDSLDLMFMVFELEELFNVIIPDEIIPDLKTIGDLVEYMESIEGIKIPEAPDEVEEEILQVEEIKFLSEEEVEKINIGLFRKIEGYVNENIANWGEMCECEEEAVSLEFFLDHHLPSWRVRNDGTIDVIVEGESRESFNFEWKDEDGEERTSNALGLLQGNVSHKFDECCNNRILWDWNQHIEKGIIELFS